jgi:hypothetical protein
MGESSIFPEGVSMSERNIFEYHNGTRTVFGDPYAILRALIEGCDGDLEGCTEQWRSPSMQLKLPAINKLLNAARRAFKMTPYSDLTGNGSTDADVQAVVELFFDWSAQKKTTPENLPTEPPATDSEEPSSTPQPNTDCG